MTEPPAWVVERIRKAHQREGFDCGEHSLNEFLRAYARQNDDLELGRTFVATRPGESRVVGYYTLRAGSVTFENLPEEERKRFPRYPIPVVHLGRLAVDLSTRGQRLGEFLLIHALRKAFTVSQEVAAYAVEVIAINETAHAFYLKYGFRELKDDPRHLYLPMKTLRKLFVGS